MMLETKVAPCDIQKIKDNWMELSIELNNLPGAKKDIRQWKDALNEVKTSARKKAGLLYRDQTGTGGGPKVAKDLTDLEERLLGLLSKTVVTGFPAVEEMGVCSAEPLEIENVNEVENIEIVFEDIESVPSTSTDYTEIPVPSTSRGYTGTNILRPIENVTANKRAASGQKKSSIETKIQKMASNHEECLKNMAKSNYKLAESNDRLAAAVAKLNKTKTKSSVFSLTF
ncbi:uncharacterized protein LOC126893043 [Diabrotica virgifera virgifera]|uniref:Regulatory protein zeste n=2 Tax=Diabrotica virgifera virgifera TaxID=50390 RepID=A0ABM5L924_DIAVI|nr:uncharacterized protein LOC126893043 [Diabrotica virgifera virgifera]